VIPAPDQWFIVIGNALVLAPEYALVAYDLVSTLSETGTVSRGICVSNERGLLSKITEHTALARLPNGNVGSFSKEGALMRVFSRIRPYR
jgi:hypothetical protein